jgi:hypothetical protein
MVHGILQFTPSIAFRYVLHRCESRDIRCRESFYRCRWHDTQRWPAPVPGRPAARSAWLRFLDACGAGVLVAGAGACADAQDPPPACAGRGLRAPWRLRPSAPARDLCQPVHGSRFRFGIDNDPSAGSPTETLLRLLLPLNDKVQWTSRDVAGSEPPTSPRSEHFTGPFNR